MNRVGIALEDLPRGADKLYEYAVPEGMHPSFGSCVTVPFGRSGKARNGVVLALNPPSEVAEDRVKALLTCEPSLLSPDSEVLLRFVRERYFTTWYEAARLLLPIRSAARAVYRVSVPSRDAASEYLETHADNRRHCDVLGYLLEAGDTTLQELLYLTGVSESVVKTLAKKGLVTLEKQPVRRDPLKAKERPADPGYTLTDEQQNAVAPLLSDLGTGKTHLLYGVTGSGKTLVFLRLIDEALAQNRPAVLLLPEISLTFQIVNRLYARYGEKLAVLHSGLSLGERYDEWNRIRRGEATVVVGTRSAVFAPVPDRAVFLIDEEQEHTYKSELSPRYHAREVAAFRARIGKSLLLLASATPSFESYARARDGQIGLETLKTRYNGRPLPKVLVADLRPELRAGNRSCVGSLLADEIGKNLKNGEQTILFMNRRGYASHVSCPSCGYVVTCPSCGIAMTYHTYSRRILCHYCGHSVAYRKECPDCAQPLYYTGTGTQKAEEELTRIFPELRICRMDADTVSAKDSRETMLSDFAARKYDLLLGTQMITKGLDFPDVTLVGVLNADTLLYSSDFRACERTFSLLTQVVGRAGRAGKEGRAVVQTYSPTHPVLSFAFNQDYEGFYESETALRRQLLYPPFCDLCQICFLGEEEEKTFAAAEAFCEKLKERHSQSDAPPMRLIYPRATAVPKVGGKYRVRILLKCKNTKQQREILSELLTDFKADRTYESVAVLPDMNPVSVL